MDEGDARLKRLFDLINAMRAGTAEPEECMQEMREITGWRFAPLAAMAESDIVHDRFDAGGISAAEALSIARENADAFPAVPIFFIYCSFYAHHLDATLDSIGYLALYKLKSEPLQDTEFGRYQEWEKMMQPLFAKLEKDGELLSVWPYLDEGCEHLVNHFLVQEITDGVLYEESEWRDAVLERLGGLEPLLMSMLDDQLRLRSIAFCDAPAGLDTLIALLGCRRSEAALPVLLNALSVCVGDPLNEALLALAKLGARYPEEVSRELREIAANKGYGETRLAAVEALGLLWEAPGNLDFLQGMLAGWRPDEEGGNHLFRFLVHALLAPGEPAAARAVSSALEGCRRELDDDTVFFTEDYLEHYLDVQLGPRLDDVLEEEPGDFLVWLPPTWRGDGAAP